MTDPPEAVMAGLLLQTRAKLRHTVEDSTTLHAEFDFDRRGDRLIVRYGFTIRGPRHVPAVTPTAAPDRPLTPFGVAWSVTKSAFPTLPADHAEAVAASHRRAQILADSGRKSHWSLHDDPLPGEHKAPSLMCLSALESVHHGGPFRDYLAAVMQNAAVALVAAGRALGLPDQEILARSELLEAALDAAAVGDDELFVLRSVCLHAAHNALWRAGVDLEKLPCLGWVVDRFVKAYCPGAASLRPPASRR